MMHIDFVPRNRPTIHGLLPSIALTLSVVNCSLTQPLTDSVDIKLSHLTYEEDAAAIVTELAVPNATEIEDLSQIELLISRLDQSTGSEPIFAAMLNYSDRVDPIPPGNFGVIIDPTNDDRSIANVVSAAGIPARWDQQGRHGVLLKESVSRVDDGALLVDLWIAPYQWRPGRYGLQVRAKKRDHLPTAWHRLAEFTYTGEGIKAIENTLCRVRPIFLDMSSPARRPIDNIHSVTLLIFERQPQDEGVNIQRWPGDRGSEFKYVEMEQQKIDLGALEEEEVSLAPGLYQFKHNSVWGTPPSGYYGESQFFEVETVDESQQIEVLLYPAI